MSHVSITIIMLCAILLVGFSAGRRIGIRQGKQHSKVETPLELRAKAYGTGVCPICGSQAEQCGSQAEQIVQCEQNG